MKKHTLTRPMRVADRLIRQAEDAGIRIGRVSFKREPGALFLYPEDEALTPALAVELGLTDRAVSPHYATQERAHESFAAQIGGVHVLTYHSLPARVVEDDLTAVSRAVSR